VSEPAGTELWLTERQTPGTALSYRVVRTLCHERTPYQELLVAETADVGRVLFLDGVVQLNERDEFFYHEMLAHVPLMAHPAPRRILTIGGGDGGTVREVLRHPEVEEAQLAEIDGRVLDAGRTHLPALSSALADPRAKVFQTDGIAHVGAAADRYDVILVDSTDPVGPAVGLYGAPFYAACARALRPDGILVAQSESPLLHADLIRSMAAAMAPSFPVVRLYWAPVPMYPSGMWSFLAASRGPDPSVPAARPAPAGLRYYSRDVHRAAFVLPPFVAALGVGGAPA
jgi:spermidine synthase